MDAVTYGTCAAEAHRIEGKPFLHTYMDTCQNWEARETAGEMTAGQWPELPGGERCVDVIWFRNHKPELHDFWLKFDAPLNTDIHWLKFSEAHAKQRVEQAERQWQSWGVVEIAVRNPSVAEYCKHWEGRAEAAESELREMREALGHTLLCMNRSCKYCRDLLARKAQ